MVKYIYGLVNSICARLPQSGELLCDFFFSFKHFPINLTLLQWGVFLSPFILELEGTEPQENDQGVDSELFTD